MAHRVSVMIHLDNGTDAYAESDIEHFTQDTISILAANLAYGLVEEAYGLLDDEEDE